MRVKCIQLIDEDSGKSISSSSWLSVGKEYHVLSVHYEKGRNLKFQLIGDDEQTPALHCADQFEVTSGFLPSSWCAVFAAGSHFELAPNTWIKPGFWERYFDGDPDAREEFELVRSAMMIEEDQR